MQFDNGSLHTTRLAANSDGDGLLSRSAISRTKALDRKLYQVGGVMLRDMDYKAVLENIYHDLEGQFGAGKVADYIPQLSSVPATKFGMALRTKDGELFSVGDGSERFSIQSISKLFVLTLAIQSCGDKIWERVGFEPSGDPFNSLVQLEYDQGKPRNPFINAGALLLTDVIYSEAADARGSVLGFIRSLAGTPDIDFDMRVAESEYRTGYRNIAMANFMKSFGVLENDVDPIIDAYFHHCSIEMSCVDLVQACHYLIDEGKAADGTPVIPGRKAKRINALMMTCGTYDAAGELAYRVGLPSKSGVGGGLLAILPGEFSVCVWSPGLDKTGNSLLGVKALELLTTQTGLSVF